MSRKKVSTKKLTKARKQNVRYCDKCGKAFYGAGKVKRMNTGGSSGIHLCRACWNTENTWRRRRNKTLTGKAKFPLRKF